MLLKQRIIQILSIAALLTALFFVMDSQVMAAENAVIGSKGQEVKELQIALNSKHYWCGDTNGILGPRTYNALIRYQRDHKLVVNSQINKALKISLGIPIVKQKASAADSAPAATAAKTSREEPQTVSRGTRPEGRVITMVATGYTDAPEENWPYAGAPSYIGLPLARGIVAVDPDIIPMGSKLYVEGYGEAIAADQGGAIQGNRIDLFFDSKQEAFDWGMRTIKVTVY